MKGLHMHHSKGVTDHINQARDALFAAQTTGADDTTSESMELKRWHNVEKKS